MWEKIKRIIEKEGGVCVIIENGQPVYSVRRIDDIKDETEKVNRDIESLRADESQETKIAEPAGGVPEEIKIEDLPF